MYPQGAPSPDACSRYLPVKQISESANLRFGYLDLANALRALASLKNDLVWSAYSPDVRKRSFI